MIKLVIFIAVFSAVSTFSGFTHVGRINNPYCLNGRYVAMRILTKNGEIEPNIIETTKFLNERRQFGVYHAAPCITCGNITEQALNVCNKILIPAYREALVVRFVYIDVTNPLVWSRNKNDNIDAIERFAVIIGGCGENGFHYSPAIFTTKDSWEVITSSHSGLSDLPLWYTNFDGKADHSNFLPFGGWKIPKAKTYRLSGRDECGNEDIMLGFW